MAVCLNTDANIIQIRNTKTRKKIENWKTLPTYDRNIPNIRTQLASKMLWLPCLSAKLTREPSRDRWCWEASNNTDKGNHCCFRTTVVMHALFLCLFVSVFFHPFFTLLVGPILHCTTTTTTKTQEIRQYSNDYVDLNKTIKDNILFLFLVCSVSCCFGLAIIEPVLMH